MTPLPPVAPPEPELFASGICDIRLPVREVVESFDFGQFVDLVVVDQQGDRHDLVVDQPKGSLNTTLRGAALRSTGAAVRVRMADLLGGIPLLDAAKGRIERYVRPETLIEEVKLASVDKFLSTPEVELDGQRVSVPIAADDIRMLLSGQPILRPVSLGEGDERIVKITPADVEEHASAPAVTRHTVSDLAGFLSQPLVPGVDERPFRVSLTDEVVYNLRTRGAASLPAGTGTLEITVAEQPADALEAPMEIGYARSAATGVLRRADPGVVGLQPDPLADPRTAPGFTMFAGPGRPPHGMRGTRPGTFGTPFGDGNGHRYPAGPGTIPDLTPAPRPTTTIPKVAIFLPWKQEWVLKGYTRGRLLHSLALAPQEDATIELFTWDRRKKTLEQGTTTDVEQTFEDTSNTRDSVDVYRELARSNDFQWQINGDLHATYRPGVAEIGIRVGGGITNKDSLTNIGKTTTNHLDESVQKASSRVKSQRTTRITESAEIGREERITRKIRNPNLCHTLNLDYFEVLAHYDIETTFSKNEVRLCAMVPNPLSLKAFNRLVVRTHETPLRDSLLDRALVDGFDACRLLEAWDKARTQVLPTTASADVKETETKPAEPPAATAPAPKAPSKEEKAVLSLLGDIGNATRAVLAGQVDPVLTLIGQHKPASAEQLKGAKHWVFAQLMQHYFADLMDALRLVTASTASTGLARQLSTVLPEMGSSPTPGTLKDLQDKEKEDYALGPAIHRHMDADWSWAWWSGRCREEGLYVPADAGLSELLSRFQVSYAAYLRKASEPDEEMDGATGPGAGAIAAANKAQDKATAADKLEMKYGLDVIASALEREEALLTHLTNHIQYYRYILFQALPPSEQLELLAKSGSLKVGLFEPHVVSMRGDYLAVPLLTALDEDLDTFLEGLIEDLSELDPLKRRVSIPTSGLSIEPRLGTCSACEDFVEDSRTVELRRLTAVARQAEQEADRMAARLAADPKVLDDPKPSPEPLRIRIEQPPSP